MLLNLDSRKERERGSTVKSNNGFCSFFNLYLKEKGGERGRRFDSKIGRGNGVLVANDEKSFKIQLQRERENNYMCLSASQTSEFGCSARKTTKKRRSSSYFFAAKAPKQKDPFPFD